MPRERITKHPDSNPDRTRNPWGTRHAGDVLRFYRKVELSVQDPNNIVNNAKRNPRIHSTLKGTLLGASQLGL
jgi:hypothetical protein